MDRKPSRREQEWERAYDAGVRAMQADLAAMTKRAEGRTMASNDLATEIAAHRTDGDPRHAWCFECSRDWPCLARRLADDLAAQTERAEKAAAWAGGWKRLGRRYRATARQMGESWQRACNDLAAMTARAESAEAHTERVGELYKNACAALDEAERERDEAHQMLSQQITALGNGALEIRALKATTARLVEALGNVRVSAEKARALMGDLPNGLVDAREQWHAAVGGFNFLIDFVALAAAQEQPAAAEPATVALNYRDIAEALIMLAYKGPANKIQDGPEPWLVDQYSKQIERIDSRIVAQLKAWGLIVLVGGHANLYWPTKVGEFVSNMLYMERHDRPEVDRAERAILSSAEAYRLVDEAKEQRLRAERSEARAADLEAMISEHGSSGDLAGEAEGLTRMVCVTCERAIWVCSHADRPEPGPTTTGGE